MSTFSKVLIFATSILVMACGQVGLEDAGRRTFSVGESASQVETLNLEAEELAPGSQVNSALQLLDPEQVEQLLSGVTACDEVETDSFACVALMDSFERSSIEQSVGTDGFGWSSLIDDVLGQNGARVEAQIYNETQLGMTPQAITDTEDDQGRSLVFTGRPGGSVHSVYLVSKAMDLTGFNSLLIGFEYLAIDLETWTWNGRTGNESIRLEICSTNLNDCGVLPALDKDGLNSDNWTAVTSSAPMEGQGNDGHNHSLADWKKVAANIDISQMDEDMKKNFVFRVSVVLDEGFTGAGDITSALEDGVALDNIVALASKIKVPETEAPEEDGGFQFPN